MKLIASDDVGISLLLEQFVFKGGAEMLVEAGVVEAVAEALNKFVEGEKIKSVGSSGLVQSSKLPPFLPGHLTLLNSLLSHKIVLTQS